MSDTAQRVEQLGLVTTRRRGALYSPAVDFMLLGGGSLVVLPLMALTPEAWAPQIFYFTFLLSFVINYPHFAHSYQIFYRDFPNKIAGRGYGQNLQWRYVFAGLVVPVLLVLGFWALYATGSKPAMGLAANAMGFFVGWHYVKQGYGMLIVDSVLQKSYFSDEAKKSFRVNAYACWIFFFLLGSRNLRDRDFMGMKYYFLDVPGWLLFLTGAVLLFTTLWALREALKAERAPNRALPVNGYVAYVMSQYIWIAALWTPAVLYVIPAFHSLQYLAVVWRYELNRQTEILSKTEEAPRADRRWVRLAIFIGIGSILGAAAFVIVPTGLDTALDYDKLLYGGQLATFMFLIFINIHHYFLDNVMWRKDNPDVGRHLFGMGKGK